ncbi:hypothetical protein B0H65DRAFT_443898 [Neurospora tetraspora]|uniref:Uncharacterized protein n=1 Tax=Neurospora tetraspora TaxID=94610 RepID=A0AAE0JE83_9PEZI|nr:hypothetical protein B0H65DRAFT_443898 [Neurospora tetraspora]
MALVTSKDEADLSNEIFDIATNGDLVIRLNDGLVRERQGCCFNAGQRHSSGRYSSIQVRPVFIMALLTKFSGPYIKLLHVHDLLLIEARVFKYRRILLLEERRSHLQQELLRIIRKRIRDDFLTFPYCSCTSPEFKEICAKFEGDYTPDKLTGDSMSVLKILTILTTTIPNDVRGWHNCLIHKNELDKLSSMETDSKQLVALTQRLAVCQEPIRSRKAPLATPPAQEWSASRQECRPGSLTDRRHRGCQCFPSPFVCTLSASMPDDPGKRGGAADSVIVHLNNRSYDMSYRELEV